VSGLDSVLTRIGAIERMVSGVHAPAAVGNAGAATSFADALDQAQLMDAAGVSATGSSATVGAVTSTAASPTSVATTAATSTSVTSTSAVPPAATRTAVTPAAATARPQSTPSTAVSGSRTPLAGKPAYRPAHVTETDERVWNDCTWASAAMWIDKLTGGAVKVDREALRAASGDRTGGSSLGDVVRGAKKLLGLDLRAAHDEHLTVDGLLDRLASGGGAIVQGSYASLPSSLTRNDPGFAAKGVAASGHAVYVGPLDRATGKVWWDDPLTPAGGSGQWISVRDLRTFLWKDSHGHVSALATPAGSSAPERTQERHRPRRRRRRPRRRSRPPRERPGWTRCCSRPTSRSRTRRRTPGPSTGPPTASRPRWRGMAVRTSRSRALARRSPARPASPKARCSRATCCASGQSGSAGRPAADPGPVVVGQTARTRTG